MDSSVAKHFSPALQGIRRLTPAFATAPQLGPEDMMAVAELGFRTVVSNRPDFEAGPSQPTAEAIRDVAEPNGLAFYYLPVTSGNITDDQAEQMKEILRHAPQPVLAYCLSGARSTELYCLAQLV